MRNLIIAGIIILILAVGVFFLFAGGEESETTTTTTTTPTQTDQPATSSSEPNDTADTDTGVEGATITNGNSGFSPSSVTVKSGATITWVNNSSNTIQVGSANHPTHTINQELTGNAFVIQLAPGESRSVVVTRTGTFGYHDHLNPSQVGSITVE